MKRNPIEDFPYSELPVGMSAGAISLIDEGGSLYCGRYHAMAGRTKLYKVVAQCDPGSQPVSSFLLWFLLLLLSRLP